MPAPDTALLVMDVQEGIVDRFGADELLGALPRAIDAARAHDVPVMYVKVGFRPGFPEVSPRNLSFARIAASGAAAGLVGEASRVAAAIAPQDGEIEVVKKRVSAFAGSDLEVLLRAREISRLVLAGIATSGVVLSTVRAAADLDYRLIVLRDGCLDADEEVHRVLLEKIFPRQAEVSDIDAWIASLDG